MHERLSYFTSCSYLFPTFLTTPTKYFTADSWVYLCPNHDGMNYS